VTFISALKELWKRRLLVVIVTLLAAAAAIVAVYHVSPSGLSKRSTTDARGSSEVLVDSARSPIAGSKRDISGLIVRAGVFARLMAGGDVVKQIADAAGVPVDQIDVAGPQPLPGEAPGISEAPETRPYGLAFSELAELPIVEVATRAPTVAGARALAAAAPEALRDLIHAVQRRQETPAREKVELRVLGPAQAQTFEEGPGAKIGAVIFIVLLGLGLGLILAVPRLVAAWRRADDEDEMATLPDISDPAPTLVIQNGKNGKNGKTGRGKQSGKDGVRRDSSHEEGAGRVRQRQR
jgi:hypothetical protein